MPITYTLVPREVMRGYIQKYQKPKNADDQIMEEARQEMQKVTRNYSRRSKKSSLASARIFISSRFCLIRVITFFILSM